MGDSGFRMPYCLPSPDAGRSTEEPLNQQHQWDHDALPFLSKSHLSRMSHLAVEGRTRESLLDVLTRVITTRRGTRGFVYRKIRPTMTLERDDIRDLSDVILQDNSDTETQCKRKLSKKPKRILQFSDGVMEEYSSEDEIDAPKNKIVSQIDTKNMNWLPWAWYQTTWLSSKMLDGCDYVGECLANFFGITAPKYQFEINEFYRLQALEKEISHKQDLEMGGWNEQNRNNLINSDTILTNECK
ncbi:PREDICTED: protein FAM177A1-like [Atta colombica]|uniref:protein FAM177A1-like n=1 Tax=Atta colombica TaxID=520822 RepID=UPI00084BC583|nr:PREDICTED: protein FAM177A1-like [Atta colombica]